MAINPNDDYKKLVKLLYPSIEASGNVYYGQTKKLTMDEVLGKNELNFDSHIESFREEDESYYDGFRYDSYFCWKIGPLRGSVRANISNNDSSKSTFPDVDKIWGVVEGEYTQKDLSIDFSENGTAFAKYRLDINNIRVDNTTNAGQFPTYESNVDLVFEGICITDKYGPVPEIDKTSNDLIPFGESRNFFVDNENHLYIKVCKGTIYYNSYDTKYAHLTLKAVGGSVDIHLSFSHSSLDVNTVNNSFEYKYSTDGGNHWSDCIFDSTSLESPPITVNDNETVRFKCIKYMPDSTVTDRVRIKCTNVNSGTTVEASSNALSMLSEDFSSLYDISEYNYALSGLFYDVECLTRAPKLPATTLADYSYYLMFEGCTNLTNAPELPATSLAKYCYANMFMECSSLVKINDLPAAYLPEGCYYGMFYICTSLVNAPNILAKHLAESCCYGMFSRCSSLVSPPELHTDILVDECYKEMFKGCASLIELHCDATNISATDCIENWLTDTAIGVEGVLYVKEGYYDLGWSLPNNWSVVASSSNNNQTINSTYNTFNCQLDCIDDENKYKQAYLVTSGTDSDINGRGKLNNSTLFNMESTFDESNTHKVGEYNKDGSFNQEIWGYKTFNSPVKFRNGIYGECGSLIAAPTLNEYKGIYLKASSEYTYLDSATIITTKNEPSYKSSFSSMYSTTNYNDNFINDLLDIDMMFIPINTSCVYNSMSLNDSKIEAKSGIYTHINNYTAGMFIKYTDDDKSFVRVCADDASIDLSYAGIYTSTCITSSANNGIIRLMAGDNSAIYGDINDGSNSTDIGLIRVNDDSGSMNFRRYYTTTFNKSIIESLSKHNDNSKKYSVCNIEFENTYEPPRGDNESLWVNNSNILLSTSEGYLSGILDTVKNNITSASIKISTVPGEYRGDGAYHTTSEVSLIACNSDMSKSASILVHCGSYSQSKIEFKLKDTSITLANVIDVNSLYPTKNETCSLGHSSSFRWKDIFAKNVTVDDVHASSITADSINAVLPHINDDNITSDVVTPINGTILMAIIKINSDHIKNEQDAALASNGDCGSTLIIKVASSHARCIRFGGLQPATQTDSITVYNSGPMLNVGTYKAISGWYVLDSSAAPYVPILLIKISDDYT